MSIDKETSILVKRVKRKMSFDTDQDLTTDEAISLLCKEYLKVGEIEDVEIVEIDDGEDVEIEDVEIVEIDDAPEQEQTKGKDSKSKETKPKVKED